MEGFAPQEAILEIHIFDCWHRCFLMPHKDRGNASMAPQLSSEAVRPQPTEAFVSRDGVAGALRREAEIAS